MYYGTKLDFGYILPYKKGFKQWDKHSLSPKGKMRLKWMDYISSGKTVPQCARHFDHPYRTVKYWWDRYNPRNLSSLEDKSCRPKKVRKPTISKESEQLIYEARVYELPGAGKVTLQRYMENEHGVKVGQQAIQRVINERRLKRVKQDRRKSSVRQNRKHMYTVPKEVLEQPGGLVYMDVKHLRIGRRKVYQFTALDHSTRLLAARNYTSITSSSAAKFFKYLDETYPFQKIRYLGTDNGSEFQGELEELLKSRGIEHVFSSPSSPKQNPYVERVIRTIIEEQYMVYGLEDTVELQQEALDGYVYRYNNKRPHHSLDLNTPMQMFAKLQLNNSSH